MTKTNILCPKCKKLDVHIWMTWHVRDMNKPKAVKETEAVYHCDNCRHRWVKKTKGKGKPWSVS